jgi:RNA polymerase sigma-70 factor (ECF subfamily)
MSSSKDQEQIAKQARNQELTELLAACTLNDQKAFARLYQMTSANLYGVVLRILNREAWADDCLQEAFVKIWNNAESYRPYLAAPMTWMMTIARNQALDLLRRRRREVMESDSGGFKEEVDPDPLPLDRLSQNDEGIHLQDCLDRLNENQRQTIALAYFKGLTHEELANRIDAPLGTVKTWIRRGLEQLRRCLEP